VIQADVIKFVALCSQADLGLVAGALLARMVHLYGREKTLEMLEKLIDSGEANRQKGNG
jgi:hypothetical protein